MGGGPVAGRRSIFRLSLSLPGALAQQARDLLDSQAVPFEIVVPPPGPSTLFEDVVETLVLYADDREHAQARANWLAAAGFGNTVLEPFAYDPDAWVERWKEQYVWTRISPRLAVGPAFLRCPLDVPHQAAIDPGQAFGTGTHESTRLALELIDRYLEPGDAFCEPGCGSGVLSIAALKLGARAAVLFDCDRGSCEEAEHNCRLNGVPGLIVRGGAGCVAGRFDLVAANMLAHELLPDSERLREMLVPGDTGTGSRASRQPAALLPGQPGGLRLRAGLPRRSPTWFPRRAQDLAKAGPPRSPPRSRCRTPGPAAPGGVLVLSGLIQENRGSFEAAFFADEPRFELLETREIGSWWGGAWRRVGT